MSKTKDVKRFKIPQALLGKDVPLKTILDLFSLPRVVGKLEDGSEITADIGRFGAYVKCNDDYRNLKDFNSLFDMTETEARVLFATPKEASKKTTAKKTTAKKTTKKKETTVQAVNDFGEVNGEKLYITSGRYGFYLKHGSKNIRISEKYQHDEQLCKNMTKEEALSFIKSK